MQTEQELPADVQSASKNIHSFAFLTASLEEECQLEPAISCDAVKRIYIDADGFKPDQWGKIVKQCEAKGKECFLTLPHIFRTHAMKFFSKNRKNLENAGFTGVLARTLEEVSWLKEEKIELPFALDASVYAWNREAVHTLKEMGPEFITMPWELNSRELKAVATACEKGRYGRRNDHLWACSYDGFCPVCGKNIKGMYSQKGTPYNEGPHRCRASIKGTLQLLLQYHFKSSSVIFIWQ